MSTQHAEEQVAITAQMPYKTWKLIAATIALDSKSSAFDPKLRAELQRALKTIRLSPGTADAAPSELIRCQSCRKLGETTCGNDTQYYACYEPH